MSPEEYHALNDKLENFITAHSEEAAEYISTKPRAKCRVPLESIAVGEKQDTEFLLTVRKFKKELAKKNN